MVIEEKSLDIIRFNKVSYNLLITFSLVELICIFICNYCCLNIELEDGGDRLIQNC